MFAPKQTLKSVASILAGGLQEGSIVLRAEDPTDADVEHFESLMNATLARLRRREAVLLLLGLVTVTSAVFIVKMLIDSQTEGSSVEVSRMTSALLSSIVGALGGFLFGYKTRERSVELQTYLRILKITDAQTAKRLVLNIAPNLREGKLAS